MRKRILAALLALMMVSSLLATTALAAEDTAAASDSTAQTTESAQTEGETSAEGTEEETEAEIPADPAGTLSFANINSRVRANNITIKMLDEQIASLDVLDYDQWYKSMQTAINSVDKLSWLVSLGLVDSDSYASAAGSVSSLKSQMDQLRNGDIQKDNAAILRQLRNTEDQLVMSTELLYVSLLELHNTDTKLDRSVKAMDRTLQEMELRLKLGQISALQLNQTKNGAEQLKSSQATVKMNLDNLTAQLEQLIGEEQTGKLKLTEVPVVTDEEIAAMDYDKDLAHAKEISYTLFAAQKALDDAKDTYHDAQGSYGRDSYQLQSAQHTFQSAQHTYESSVQSFELSFRTAYNAVPNAKQALIAAQAALTAQKDDYATSELKYQQGNISANALQTAKDSLDDAQTAVDTARHDLFTAYRTYYWAATYGILN